MNLLSLLPEKLETKRQLTIDDMVLPNDVINAYYKDKVYCYKNLDDMPAEDRDFVVMNIYADWHLPINNAQSFIVAKRILLNSIKNN